MNQPVPTPVPAMPGTGPADCPNPVMPMPSAAPGSGADGTRSAPAAVMPAQAIGLAVSNIEPSDVDRVPPLLHSLATFMRLLGKPVTLNFLQAGIVGGMSNISPIICLRTAHRAGLDARIIRRDSLGSIPALTMPCILLLKNQRSCVLLERTDTNAVIILPEEGEQKKTVPLVQLEEDYTCYAIFGALESKLDARATSLRLLEHKRWFWDVILHYMPIYKHVLIASVLINIIGVASSLFAMNVYDRVVPNNATDTLWVLASGICLAYLCDFILRNIRGYFVDLAGRNADVVLSSKLVNKVLGMRLASKPESTGALVNNLREFESLREFFSSGSLLAFVDVPFLVLFLVLIAYLTGPLVWLPLAALPVMLTLGLLLQHAARTSAAETYKQNMQKNALLVELVSGLETLKTCGAESRWQLLWEQLVDMAASSSTVSKRYSTLSMTVASSVTQLVSVGMIVWGVYLIAAGQLTMGGLIGANILVGRAMAPIMQISGMLTRLQQSKMALKSLDLLMELPSEDEQGEGYVDAVPLQPALSFEHVSFSYPGADRPALADVTLNIRPHEKVGIVGRMGSGKSTVGKLLLGLYPPDTGSVRYGGVDIRQLDTADLRSRMGFLPQDVVLFYGSVRDNIAFSDPGIADRYVLRAAYLAGATDFIREHPAGFGAQVGERGMALSGGQRQSLALARALLHDPEVLILDEPTSNMDNATEAQIKSRLEKISEDKTLIIITHRPSLLDLVNRLIVIEQGKIIADGPKDDVLRVLNGTRPAEGR